MGHLVTMALALRPLILGAVLVGCETMGSPPPGASGGSPSVASGGAAAGGAESGGPSGGAAAGGTESGGAAASGGSGPGGGTMTGGSASGGAGSGGAAGGSGGAVDPTCSAGVDTVQPPGHLTLSGNTFAHDPTMIRVGDTYYRFWTGDFIPMATSTDLRNWSNAPTVYGNQYPEWVASWLAGVPGETFNFPWAPDVVSFGGQVHLYSTFSAKFGDNISCITHLSTPSLAATPFTDHGPVVCTEGNESYNAIDADVGFDAEGAPWLSFGSFWDGIMLARLEADGSLASDELTNIARASQIEAPVLFYRCGYYYLLVSFGLCCPGEGRSVNDLTYRVVVGRAEAITGPYVDRAGTAMTNGGGALVVEGDGVNWAAAGHSDVLLDGDHFYHLYHAYRQSNGAAELRIVELVFDEDGWPIQHAP